MDADSVINIGQGAMRVIVLLSAPVLLTALVVGLVIGMVQAATQIQEMTLSFIPKLLGIVGALVIAGPWMLGLLMDYTTRLISNIPALIG